MLLLLLFACRGGLACLRPRLLVRFGVLRVRLEVGAECIAEILVQGESARARACV